MNSLALLEFKGGPDDWRADNLMVSVYKISRYKQPEQDAFYRCTFFRLPDGDRHIKDCKSLEDAKLVCTRDFEKEFGRAEEAKIKEPYHSLLLHYNSKSNEMQR